MEILRGYARTLQKIHGPDDPLCARLQGFMLINAAEIVRNTKVQATLLLDFRSVKQVEIKSIISFSKQQ